jgi:hypothetical protein
MEEQQMTTRYSNRHHNNGRQSDNSINRFKLARRMEELGCDKKDLAELAEISVGHVSNVLKGDRGVSNEVLERIAWALDTTTYAITC